MTLLASIPNGAQQVPDKEGIAVWMENGQTDHYDTRSDGESKSATVAARYPCYTVLTGHSFGALCCY